MTSGDEPQLGGQDHDNAPMISGRGTKIIVSARGAYLAGNLKALIELMEPAQRITFKQTVIQPAHDCALAVMEQFPEIEQHFFPELCSHARMVTQWLAKPDEHIEQALTEFVEAYGIGADYGPEDESIGLLLMAVSEFEPDWMPFTHWATATILKAHEALNAPFNLEEDQECEKRLNTWYLELAWAMLQGKSLPPSPSLEVR